MRAAVFPDFCGTDDIGTREVDDPQSRPGEAVVEVDASSINRHDR